MTEHDIKFLILAFLAAFAMGGLPFLACLLFNYFGDDDIKL